MSAQERHPVTGRFMAGDCERDCLEVCAGLCGALPVGGERPGMKSRERCMWEEFAKPLPPAIFWPWSIDDPLNYAVGPMSWLEFGRCFGFRPGQNVASAALPVGDEHTG